MSGFKSKLYVLLEAIPRHSRAQRIFDLFLSLLILANVLAVIVSTVNSFAVEYERWIFWFEIFSVAVFTLELLLRYWVADMAGAEGERSSRLKFWTSPYTLIDLLAIAPFYFGFILNADLRLLRLLRLFRVFRFSPYFRSLALLGNVIRQEYRPMLSALTVILILMLIASGGIYLLERESQPDTFGDLPSALWWVVVTLSTVGYGDAVPQTGFGRMLGAVIMILGVGMVALPAGMLASRFSQVMHRQQDLFRMFVEKQIEKRGAVDERQVEQRRQELFISRAEARSIIASSIEALQSPLNFCPHCGKKLPDHNF
ncbi:MAG: ion transporter [Candidatus Thiodiazotropha lotti]|nr:ion transporter [Candidatus Thiodiazotropha lotti]